MEWRQGEGGMLKERLVSIISVPCYVDAKGCACLLSSALVNVPGRRHHLLHAEEVIQVKLMDHPGPILHHADLQAHRSSVRRVQTAQNNNNFPSSERAFLIHPTWIWPGPM